MSLSCAFCAPLSLSSGACTSLVPAVSARPRAGVRSRAAVRRRQRRVACTQQRAPEGAEGGSGAEPHKQRRGNANYRAPEYYANVGTVIDTLRADYPHLLNAPPQLAIYTERVCFSDASGNCIRGKSAYSNLFWLLRMQATLFLSAHCVSVQSIFHDDVEGCIYIRWRVQFSPRSWTLLSSATGGAFVVDGMSLYRLDRAGWVYHHSLENSVRRRTPSYVMERVWRPVRARAAEPNMAGVRLAHLHSRRAPREQPRAEPLRADVEEQRGQPV